MTQHRRGNRQLTRLLAVALVAVLAGTTAAWAESDGTAGAQFLRLGAGARAAALGGTYTGIADDVYATHWNPAGLAQLTTAQAAAQHLNQFGDITHQYLAVAFPYGQKLTFGADLLAMQADDNYRTELTDGAAFTNRDLALGISASYLVQPQLAFGATLRWLDQELATSRARGWAADLGILYRPQRDWSFGVAMLNAGPEITFERQGDDLPTVVRLGLAHQWSPSLLLATDVVFPNDGDEYLTVGAEYAWNERLALRAGYEVGTDFHGLDALSAGLAFNWQAMNVDYAFVPRAELGNVHRVGLKIAFDGLGTRDNPMLLPEAAYMPPVAPQPQAVPAPASTVPVQRETAPPRVTVPAPPTRPAPAPEPVQTAPVLTVPQPPAPRIPVTVEPAAPPAPPAATPLPVPPAVETEQAADAAGRVQQQRNLPASYAALYRLGRQRLAAGDYADAVIVLMAANEVRFENFEAHYALACAFYALGDYASSVRELDLARRFLQ